MKRIMKIYFSPVGTTERIASAAAESMALKLGLPVEVFDFTPPGARAKGENFPALSSEDIVVFAIPTYAGRVPNVLLKYLDTIRGGSSRAIAMTSFGNRNFDNSLAELRDILSSHGFEVIASAAVACQHAFSETLGKGRPDAEDIAEIKEFALKVCEKLESGCDNVDASGVGRRQTAEGKLKDGEKQPAEEKPKDGEKQPAEGKPKTDIYGGYYKPQDRNGNHIDIRKVTPKVSDKCVRCGLCAEICPMGSISKEDVRIMKGICIKCNACVKKCPSSARYFDDEGYLYHKTELEEMYSRRAENRFFI